MKFIPTQKIGKWTLISQLGNKWMCACECGTRRFVLMSNLRDGRSKSCGCSSRALHHATMAKTFPNKEALHA